MRLVSLRLRGIGCFDREVEFPLDKFEQDDRLIAIVGGNGTGKSTAIGCLPGALYRQIPGYGSLAQMANTRNSMVELLMDVGGTEYTCKLLIDGTVSPPRQQAYCCYEGDSCTSGKVTDYDRYISDHFPGQNLYLSSAFAAQGGGGRFLELPISARRLLFAHMLGLGNLQQLSSAAKDYHKDLKGSIASKVAAIAAIESISEDPDMIQTELALAEKEQIKLTMAREILEVAQESATSLMVDWKHKHTELTIALVDQRSMMRSATDSVGVAARNLEAVRKVRDDIGKNALLLAAAKKELDGLYATAQYSGDADMVEAERFAEKCADKDLAYNKIFTGWQNDCRDAGLAASKAAHKVDSQLTRARAAFASVDKDIARVRSQSDVAVPCDDATMGKCPLMIVAVAAKAKLPGLCQNREMIVKEIDDLSSTESMFEVSQLQIDLELLKQERPQPPEDMRPKIAAMRTAARMEIEIAHAVRVKRSVLLERIAALESGSTDIKQVDIDVRQAQLELDTANGAVRGMLHSVSKAKDAIDAIGEEPTAIDPGKLVAARTAESKISNEVATLETRLERAAHDRESADKLTTDLAVDRCDSDDWSELSRVLGPEGVQALLIDAAGPEVGDIANDLLSECYGDRFALQLTTTRLKADGKTSKEVFDLVVLDNERGREALASQLSGGERVIIEEALSLAIAIYNTRRSGIEMSDLFRDECSGALHPTVAPRYIAMLRKALDVGGFSRCYFITHQHELVDLADGTIEFRDGGIF